MRKRFRTTGLVIALSIVARGGNLLAQGPASLVMSGCEIRHTVLAPRNPRFGADGRIVPGQTIVQMALHLNESTTVKVVEYPRSDGGGDAYNSTIIVQHGQEQKNYALGRRYKFFGQSLRIVETAAVCSSPSSGTAFFAFEAGMGAAEVFAIIRYSSDGADVQMLPMVYQGRIVVKKIQLNKVELWSAKGSAGKLECDGCEKDYALRICEIGEHSVTCKERAGAEKLRSASEFISARIDVH